MDFRQLDVQNRPLRPRSLGSRLRVQLDRRLSGQVRICKMHTI